MCLLNLLGFPRRHTDGQLRWFVLTALTWKSLNVDLHLATTPQPPPLTAGRKLRPALPSSARASALTSRAGVAQGAADFILVQVGERDHEDVGTPAQGAVIGSLAPHFLRGQRPAGHRRAGGDVAGAGTLSTVTLLLAHRPDPGERTSYRQGRDAAPKPVTSPSYLGNQ